jgi:phosphoglycerol transferase
MFSVHATMPRAPSYCTAPPAAESRDLPARRGKAGRTNLLAGLVAATLATVIGVWALQLWKAELRVPFVFGPGDDLFNLMAVKDIMTHGWDLTNPSLGAPFGQELYDFPAFSGDSLYMVIIKILGLFLGDPAVVINVFFLLGFPAIAVMAFGILRRLGISTGSAIVCAVLYAVLPYRLDSYEVHPFLASYFLVPLCCYLTLASFAGSELFARNERRGGLRAYLTARTMGVVVLCVLVGSADNYFALFTVALMAPAAILAFLTTRRARPLICGLVAVSIILATVTLNGLPTIIYHSEHGPDAIPTTRVPQESNYAALTLANLVLPVEGSRIPLLAHLAHRYYSTVSIPSSEAGWTNLGIVGTFGLLWLVVVLGACCVRGEGRSEADLLGVRSALGATLAFLIGTVGGLATLFAYVVSPLLHAPNRIVVFIAFFALIGAGLGLDRLLSRRGRRMSVAALATVLVLGVLYQTSPIMVPDYESEISAYNSRVQLSREIESQVPPNASIFQIPYFPFPTSSGNLAAYFVSNNLRWSGGAMQGRPTDWVPALLKKPTPQIVEGVSAAGFSGIYTEEASGTVLRELSNTLGVAPLIGGNGQLAFFNMASYNQRLRRRHSAAQIASIAAAELGPRG